MLAFLTSILNDARRPLSQSLGLETKNKSIIGLVQTALLVSSWAGYTRWAELSSINLSELIRAQVGKKKNPAKIRLYPSLSMIGDNN